MANTLNTRYIDLSNAGGAQSIDITESCDLYVITGTGALAGDWTISPSAAMPSGQVRFSMQTTFTLNAHTFTIFGSNITEKFVNKSEILCTYNDVTTSWVVEVLPSFLNSAFIIADYLSTASITNAYLANLNRGYLKVGNASNRPSDVDFSGNGQIPIGDGSDLNSVGITGVITLSSAGVTAFAAGSIVNADINASAAIAFSKLETLASANILVGSAGNVAAAVAMSGHVAIDNTGATTIQPNVITPAMLNSNGAKELECFNVSFENTEQGNNSIIIPYAGTLDFINACVSRDISGANDGTITAQINGIGVTSGVITVLALATVGTSFSTTPTALNSFAAGDTITLITNKGTAGGKCLISLNITRI